MISPSLRRLLVNGGIIAALLLFTLLSVLPNASTRFFAWPWPFYGQLLLLAPLILLGTKLAQSSTVAPRRLLSLVALALAIGMSVIFSRHPAFSLEAALFLWSGLAWCGWVALKTSDLTTASEAERLTPLPRIIGLLLFLPTLAGLLYWLQDAGPNALRQDTFTQGLRFLFSWRNQHPFGHWNYTGGFALIALPWFVTLHWTERGRWRAVWLLSSVACVILFFSASSRGATLGLLLMLAAAYSAAIFIKKLSRKKAGLIALAGCVLTAALLSSNPRLRNVLVSPSGVLQPNEGDVQRIAMLQGGWLLAQQRPWLGHGPGMTPFVYPEVRARLVGGVETSFQLHNGPLQLWVDHGLLGVLCALTLAAVLLRSALRWLKSPPSHLRSFALASAAALLGYAVMFVTDYQLNVLGFIGVLSLYAGLVLAAPAPTARGRAKPPAEPPLATSSHAPRWTGLALLTATALSLVILVPAWRARQAYWNAWETDVPDETLAYLQRATELAPRNPYYLNQLALRQARLAETTTDATMATTLRHRAREELTHSLTLDPAQEPVQAALGWLALSENPAQAETHFHAALALLPDRDTLHFGLALARLAQNDQPGTTRELALECLVNPLFLASPYWQQEPFRSLRPGVNTQLFQDYALALQHAETPAWRKPHLRYAAAFARWWFGGPAPDASELTGAAPWQSDFFESLPTATTAAQHPNPKTAAPWELLAAALREPQHAESMLRSPPKPPSDTAIVGALARLATKPTDISQLLRSPAPNGSGVVDQKITRGHYSIMNSNLDGPGYEDLAPRRLDNFPLAYASGLFPLRSALPGPVILDLMEIR